MNKEQKWGDYSKLVMSELKRLNHELGDLNEKVDDIAIDIAALKVRASAWGIVAGGIISLAIVFLSKLIESN